MATPRCLSEIESAGSRDAIVTSGIRSICRRRRTLA
jgi:hypothetical protein